MQIFSLIWHSSKNISSLNDMACRNGCHLGPPYRLGVPGHQRGHWITCVAKAQSLASHHGLKIAQVFSLLLQSLKASKDLNHEHPITKKTSRNKLKQSEQPPMPTWFHHRGGTSFVFHSEHAHGFLHRHQKPGEVTNMKYRINYLFCYLWKYKKLGSFGPPSPCQLQSLPQ